MKNVNVYLVSRFTPAECPRCTSHFKGPNDFNILSVGGKTSFQSAAALANENRLFIRNEPVLVQFVRCKHCDNVTMIFNFEQKYVFNYSEAQEYIGQGFTSIFPVTINEIENPSKFLSYWFCIMYDCLSSKAEELRNSLTLLKDHEQRAVLFERGLHPIIKDIVHKVAQNDLEVHNCKYKYILNNHWKQLSFESHCFLTAAQMFGDNLTKYSQQEIDVDFSAPVLMFNQVLEKELFNKIFKPFSQNEYEFNYQYDIDNPWLKKSIKVLKQLCIQERRPSLGEMAYCLQTLVSSRSGSNWFKTFTKSNVKNFNLVIVEEAFPQRLIDYINTYRNRCAILGPLSRYEYEKCESFLFYEPVKLIHLLTML